MRLGLFGGMFDPVHHGHVQCAASVRRLFGLDTVLFIPAANPPHKKGVKAPAKDRLHMLELALEDKEGLRVSDMEIRRGSTSYTVDTLRHAAEEYPGSDLWFIMGLDAFRELHTWKEAEAVLARADLVVMYRPGWEEREVFERMGVKMPGGFTREGEGHGGPVYRYDALDKRVYFAAEEELDISSTAVRGAVREGRPADGLVGPRVAEYINEKELYR